MPPKVAGQTYCLQKLERATTTVDVPKTLLKCQSLSDEGSLAEIGSYVLIGRFPGLVVGCGGDMCPHVGRVVVGPAARAYVVHREHTSGEELVYIAVLALLGMKLPFANEPHRESHVGSMA